VSLTLPPKVDRKGLELSKVIATREVKEEPKGVTMLSAKEKITYSVSKSGRLKKRENVESTYKFAGNSSSAASSASSAGTAETFHDFIESGEYRSTTKAGKGSYGFVYRFEKGGQKYILKAYEQGINKDDINNEIDALIALNGSPYVVKLLAAEVYPTKAFLLFPYVEGQTLDKWLATAPSLEEENRVFYQLRRGYMDIHSQGYIHRDIKPENIWVPSDTRLPPFYLDFGLAAPITETKSGEDRGAIKAYKENTGQTGEILQTQAINEHAYDKMYADSLEKIREYARIKLPSKNTYTPLPPGIGNAEAGTGVGAEVEAEAVAEVGKTGAEGGTRKRRRGVSRRMKKAHKTLRNRRSHLSSIRLNKRRNTRF
jgi:serine/threonine protein kinase